VTRSHPPAGREEDGCRSAGAGAGPGSDEGTTGPGRKVLVGCGAAMLVLLVVTVVGLGAGLFFFGQTLRELSQGLEEQTRATEAARALERAHPFEPEAANQVGESQALAFLEATDQVWETLEPWRRELNERARMVEGEVQLRDVAGVLGGVRTLGAARLAFVEALATQGMPVSEYRWTGERLLSAHGRLHRSEVEEEDGTPAVARQFAPRLDELQSPEGRFTGKGLILALAWLFEPDEGP
jgi:hypothetical protein